MTAAERTGNDVLRDAIDVLRLRGDDLSMRQRDRFSMALADHGTGACEAYKRIGTCAAVEVARGVIEDGDD